MTFTVDDGDGGTSATTSTATINVTNVDGAPTAQPDSFTTSEIAPVSGNLVTNDTDADGGAAPVVTAINGNAASVGQQITLASGALLTVNANGTSPIIRTARSKTCRRPDRVLQT